MDDFSPLLSLNDDDMDCQALDPDSMELFMQDISLPEKSASFHCQGHCSLQGGAKFHAESYVKQGELSRFLSGQNPTPHFSVSKI